MSAAERLENELPAPPLEVVAPPRPLLRYGDLTGSHHRAIVESWGESLSSMAQRSDPYPIGWALAWLNLREWGENPTVDDVLELPFPDVERFIEALGRDVDPTSASDGGR